VDRLPIHFAAGAIGGFTPLDHGDPVLFRAVGDRSPRAAPDLCPSPRPFYAAANIPGPFTGKSAGRMN
jgi:hypothetical protein